MEILLCPLKKPVQYCKFNVIKIYKKKIVIISKKNYIALIMGKIVIRSNALRRRHFFLVAMSRIVSTIVQQTVQFK